jgi:hypothetical protein
MRDHLKFGLAAILSSLVISSAASAQSLWEDPATPPPAHETQPAEVEANLKIFDTLDFDVFSNQQWDRLGESHADDIVVTWPDGHETKGIDQHIERFWGGDKSRAPYSLRYTSRTAVKS